MSTFDIYRSVLISLFVLFDATSFKAWLISLEHPVIRYLEWFAMLLAPAGKELMERTNVKDP